VAFYLIKINKCYGYGNALALSCANRPLPSSPLSKRQKGTSSSLRLSSHFVSRPQGTNNKYNNADDEVYQKAKSTTTMATAAEDPLPPTLPSTPLFLTI